MTVSKCPHCDSHEERNNAEFAKTEALANLAEAQEALSRMTADLVEQRARSSLAVLKSLAERKSRIRLTGLALRLRAEKRELARKVENQRETLNFIRIKQDRFVERETRVLTAEAHAKHTLLERLRHGSEDFREAARMALGIVDREKQAAAGIRWERLWRAASESENESMARTAIEMLQEALR